MNEILIKPGKAKLAAVFIGSAVFVALCAWIAASEASSRINHWKLMVVYTGIPFFSLTLFYSVYRIFIPKPLLVLTDRGLHEDASIGGNTLIRWDEITDISVYEFNKQKFLGIQVLSPNALLDRVSPVKRKLMEASMALGTPPVNIPQVALAQPLEEVAEIIREHHKKFAHVA